VPKYPLSSYLALLFFLPTEIKEEEFTADEADEISKIETKNPHKPPTRKLLPCASSDTDWDNGSDDASFLEATEDVELAEAAENSLLSYNSVVDEIPDELIIEATREVN
jgi:hypothetical protein